MMISASECIPIEYIKDQIEEYRKFDHLGMYAEFLDMFIQDYKDNAMANYADRKTENSSEKPNNCELQTIRCPKCGKTDYIRDMEKDMGIKDSHYKYKCINCNFYIKTEPQTEDWHDDCNTCRWQEDNACTIPCCDYEPQTDCSWK